MATEFLPELDITAPARQRRWTVLLRWLLLVPQFIVMWALGIATAVVAVISWFAALFLGRLPDWSIAYLSGYLGYYHRVAAYALLLVDTYPPFSWSSGDHPVSVRLAPGRLNRLAVLFRIVLVIPAAIVLDLISTGLATLVFFFWLIMLVIGRTPVPVFGATAATLRYTLRVQAYFLLLSSSYPKGLFGEPHQVNRAGAVGSDTRPLVLSSGGRVLLIVFIVLGVLGSFGGGDGAEQANSGNNQVRSTY
ncbi:MAG TPA: DUF4389 domain-containing protein [Pseudonocardiaceae bacterium]|jgi:hypothetical protein|nr:DUF4389 domain-containing protein [Pseudonocardiaceae bacterium]